ncbi:hypothetical protein G7Z17_g11190 [Cylindrodendrum hubeiense]|uniref:Uncharacterized protein n=1 Tax=Cylindrodendrum hubeiense TaxID=595255 RepID=A0A9P5H4G3_9HYPO|nr:hypothetical protein G7Z17_g11190 [Cylindrodendrum hubeiense]
MTCIDSPAVVWPPPISPCLACLPPPSVVKRAVIPSHNLGGGPARAAELSKPAKPTREAKTPLCVPASRPKNEGGSIASAGRAAAHQLQWDSAARSFPEIRTYIGSRCANLIQGSIRQPGHQELEELSLWHRRSVAAHCTAALTSPAHPHFAPKDILSSSPSAPLRCSIFPPPNINHRLLGGLSHITALIVPPSPISPSPQAYVDASTTSISKLAAIDPAVRTRPTHLFLSRRGSTP